MVSSLAITALAAALLSACAVGPDHVRPHLAVPERFGKQAGAVRQRNLRVTRLAASLTCK